MDKQKEKQFVEPKLDIIFFQNEDIICTSPADTIPDENLIP